jgi:hypothetical protein
MINPETLYRLNAELDESMSSTVPGSRSGDRMWESFHGPRTVRFTAYGSLLN